MIAGGNIDQPAGGCFTQAGLIQGKPQGRKSKREDDRSAGRPDSKWHRKKGRKGAPETDLKSFGVCAGTG